MPKLKPARKGNKKTGGIVLAVTLIFAAIGTVCLIIGYKDEVLHFLVTTGIALLIVAAVPIVVFAYQLIQKRIDS